ncbi:hypothetical protein HC744_00015 [Arthrobacter sp. S1_S22]|nr:hypothetical protein [Arthrobacter sp. S1_S22]
MIYNQFSGLWNFPALITVCLIVVSGLMLIHVIGSRVTSLDVRPLAYLAMTASTLFLLYRIYTGEIVELDERVWHELAAEAGAQLSAISPSPGALSTLPPGKEGYVWILGWTYVISGPAPMVPIVLNIILHGILTIVLARTAEVISLHLMIGEKSRVSAIRFVGITTAVVPSIVFWVPLVLRETLCLLCIALAVLFALHLVATGKLRFLIFLAPPTAVLVWVRGSIGLALLAGLLLGWSFSWLRKRRFPWVGRLFLSIPVAVTLISLWSAVDSQTSLDASDIATRSVDLSTTASSGFPGIRASSSITDIILIQGPRVAFGPFLWEFRPVAVMFLAFIEAMSWLACLFLALKAKPFRSGDPLHRALAMLVASVAIVLLLALAISIGNYGTLARLRPMVFVVLLPLAGVGYARIRGRSLQAVA